MEIARREFLRAAAVLGPVVLVLGGAEVGAACDVDGRIAEHAAKPQLKAPRYVTKVVRRVTPSGIGYNEVLSLPA